MHLPHPEPHPENDDGQILILLGLLLAPLLVFAAFATDVGAWVTTAGRMQRAADAAALAGADQLPDVTEANKVALGVMMRNGYEHGIDSMSVTITSDPATGVLVSASDGDPPMFFASLVLPSLTLDRQATAIRRPTLKLGSPGNGLGNDPERGQIPNYWLATFGPTNTKENGDRYHTRVCGVATTPACSGTVNDEYDPNGYVFEAEVQPSNPLGDLVFEAFDPVLTNSGIICDLAWLLPVGTAATNPTIAGNAELSASDPARFEQGAGGWCVGDSAGHAAYTMTMTVRAPDQTPATYLDNPVECVMQFTQDNPVDQADFLAKLASNATTRFDRWVYNGGAPTYAPVDLKFRDYFRNHVEICSVSRAVQGTYYIQVRTNADESSRPGSLQLADATNDTWGYNFYSLRVGWGRDSSSSRYGSGLSLSAASRLPIYINAEPNPLGNTLTDFTLVRANKLFAGEQIVIDFFDISDGSGDITLRLRPPASYEASGGTMTCAFTKAGVPKIQSSPCEIKEVAGAGNGLVYRATINVPADYDCDATDNFDCWFRAEMTFSAQPHDVTTWSANAPGKPTRLTG